MQSPSTSTTPPPGLLPEPKPPKRDKRLYLIIAAVALVVIGLFVAIGFGVRHLLLSQRPPATDTATDQPKPTNSTPRLTAFEKKLTEEERARLADVTWPLYLPPGFPERPLLGIVSGENPAAMLTYGVNLKYGSGLVQGSEGYHVYPAGPNYNPPSDCAIPGGRKPSSPMKCELYKGSSPELPAYIYWGYGPGGITNTTIKQPLIMYMKRGGSVIALSTADTDPSVLYEKLKSLKETPVKHLPAETEVYFD